MVTASVSKSLKRPFLYSLISIGIVLVLAETFVILLLETLPAWGIRLTPLQENASHLALLFLLATPLTWWWALQPLIRKISLQQTAYINQINENQQLRHALDFHVLISITDVAGRITYVNRKFCEVSGFSESELLGQDHRIVNSGYHDKEFIRQMWRTIAQGQPWEGEFCNRNKEGRHYWVASTIIPMPGLNGKPTHYLSIRREITKIKENEIRLLTLKQALDASSEMIIVTDDRGCIQYVNPALCDSTGWKEEILVGRPPDILDSPNADPQSLREMRNCLRHGKTWSGRLLNWRKGTPPFQIAGQTPLPDTRDYWAEVCITPIHNHGDEIIGYVQIQRDITDQVHKEQAQILENADTVARLAISETLQQTLPLQQRFIQVLDILFNLKAFDLQRKGGVFLKDPNEDCLDLFMLHGKFSEEFIRREQRVPFGACLCGRAAVSQELIVSNNCFCDPRHEHQFEGMQAHGHYIVPIVSAGVTLGILFLYTDPHPLQMESRLTMLRQVGDMMGLALLQEQAKNSLEKARNAAEEAAKTKAEFLANMSHEIRTPMNGVLGMLDILKDTDMSYEQKDLLETAANSAESLLAIINDILDFSKLEAGKCELEQIEFNLPALVEEICALMSVRAHAKGLELNCFLPPTLPTHWLGDPNRIRQVLVNLVGNAVKFTEQGEVSVKVLAQEASADDNSMLRVEIKDTGIGMSPEGQTLLFQPFAQADNSTARRFGGTGLGLSISKNLIDLMKGDIGVESAPAKGTCFWFTLPLQPVDNHAAPPLADLSGKRALVVDDNDTNRKILRYYLQHWGMLVSEVDNAPAALTELQTAALKNEAYDILLSDLHMPDMDGYALARAIATHPAIAATPRLLLSSGGMGSEADRTALGFAQSLLKPVRQAQLLEAITSALHTPLRKTTPPTKTAENLPDYGSKQILVVEDNKINQKVILAMLGKFRCTPDLAENGREALDKLALKAYDLVFMDCQMPVMDGYEAVRLLRNRESSLPVRTPVVALTAHAAVGEREKCLAAGMDDFLSKPIIRQELAEALARWLGDASSCEIMAEAKSVIADNLSPPCWDEAEALKRLDNDQELLNDMIDLFFTATPDRLLELEEALTHRELTALADTAHAIKGMAGHFCAAPLYSAAAKLEHSARQDEPGDFQQMTRDVADAALQLMAALRSKQGVAL
ncbi:response regulator [Methylomicrobium sp. RS1]|uniref:response regulator n=1 Tax=Candidatus Methylomicrobium oryzae TaxID=2802053 RepID=UPI001923561F|nr:response regulator [Methylomicrobium sp. RS1]MBL1265148.1 response regulator [Methylomicrobium sp. RS1]